MNYLKKRGIMIFNMYLAKVSDNKDPDKMDRIRVTRTLEKGTAVKIIKTGSQDTIDGITSNWVQVEVQAGAKDRNGKSITAGTSGWCFGGYLE
jgi:hypothetical protein